MDLSILNQPFALTKEQVEFYQKNAFIKIKTVLPPEIIAYFNAVISEKVAALNQVIVPLEERNTYGKAFLQLFNLWTEDEKIKALIFSKRLAQLAADLMQVDGVRLYHDQALFKEAGGGITPWHADQHYWPLSSDKTITAWIPLQHTPLEMGPLEFSAGSQQIMVGRELSISDDSEQAIKNNLRINNLPHIVEPFDLGEISFHSGWVFHRAGANTSEHVRKVMTIIYMDKEMRLKKPENSGQENDWKTWCPGVEIGQVVNSALNPVLYDGALDA
ncbi:MAG: phytanoyl-CoA dioxygenase family protein [Saprospiraceae bacterium]|nr:phytanoyl-CoA dioxygenase family protein [Saprospiraceae bacterium]